jgi:hypothetical protein
MDPFTVGTGILGAFASLFGGGQQQAPPIMKYQGEPPLVPTVPLDLQTSFGSTVRGTPVPGPVDPTIGLSPTAQSGSSPLLDLARAGAAGGQIARGVQSPSPAAPAASAATDAAKSATKAGSTATKAVAGAAPKAAAASGGKFLGLDGGQWSAIGTASGILASLFQQGPAPQVLNPSIPMDNKIPLSPLGGDLGGGPQRVSGLSQFAINQPSLGQPIGGGTDIISQLRKLGAI